MSHSYVLLFTVKGMGWECLKAGKPVARISRCFDTGAAQALDGYRGFEAVGPFVIRWHSRNQLVRGSVRGYVETAWAGAARTGGTA